MAVMWDSIQQATTRDKEMAQLVSIIDSGFFQFCQDLQPSLQECYQFWKHLCIANGLILCKDHIGITTSLRTHIYITHSIHQGNYCILAMHHSSYHGPGGKHMALSQPSATLVHTFSTYLLISSSELPVPYCCGLQLKLTHH